MLAINSKAQSVEQFIESQNTAKFQKLYLHTDREFYFMGDTLWFSAYLVNAEDHIFNLDTCNLYFELFSNEGEVMQKELVLLRTGFASGFLDLGDKLLAEGNYTLRAYTDNIKQLGNEYFYSKKIRLSAVKTNISEPDSAIDKRKRISFDFYPEGGFLLEGQVNQMVFKAYDENNKPLNVSGRLVVGSMQQPLTFFSEYNGMGRIYFIPDANEKYKIELDEFKVGKAKIPEIKQGGAKLMLTKINKDDLSLNILSNAGAQDFYLVFLHRGEGNNYFKIDARNNGKTIKVLKKNLKQGINRIILLDDQFQPLSERLFFLNDPDQIVGLKVSTPKQQITTRDEIQLRFDTNKKLEKDEIARVSVTVVSNDILDKGVSQNIQSYLLLDSELKGDINNTADYFIDSEELSSEKKLDLLMLCNGWSNYVWNDRVGKEILTEPPLAGINIHGNVTRFLSKKPLVGTDVLLSVRNSQGGAMETTQTDEFGNFAFKNFHFYDTTLVLVQAFNYRDKSNTTLHLKYAGMEASTLRNDELFGNEVSSNVPISLYRQKYVNEKKLDEFYPDRNSRILEEIKVVAEKKEIEDDGHFRIYTPSKSIKVEPIHSSYGNVFDFMQGRFAGVQVVGTQVTIRGPSSLLGSNAPLFLIDGMPTNADMVASLPMFDVDKVEVIKGPAAAIFGMRGGNGVVSILTKRGFEYTPEPKEIPGTFIEKIKGFQPYREFYSPRYSQENIQSEIPDYRTTLYWNPSIILGKKEAKVSFFSCDNLARYRVIVEGISTSGRICIGETFFDVDERKYTNR